MKDIRWRDEKLYRVSAQDYGRPLRRACGMVLYSLAKGTVIAVALALLFAPRSLEGPGKQTFELFLAVAVISGVCVGLVDRRVYVCEIEIFSDRIVRHSGEKTSGIGLSDVRTIKEGSSWTLFGFVNGLSIRGKKGTIFIPEGCTDYLEIKSKLGAWRSAFA